MRTSNTNNNNITNTRTRKDRLFIIIMAIVIANLSYVLINIISYLVAGGYTNAFVWTLAITNVIGIAGALWLVRQERERRKIGQSDREAAESTNTNEN